MQNPQPNVPSQLQPNYAIYDQAQNQATSRDPKRVAAYSCKAARVTGAIQLSCGAASVIFGVIVISIIWNERYYVEMTDRYGSGIWGGILFFVTGLLGLASSSKKRALIVAYMVMCIISALAAALGILFTASSIAGAANYYSSFYDVNQSAHVANQVFNVLLLVVLLVEFIVVIVGSAFACCSGLCCAGTQGVTIQERVIYVPTGSQPLNFNVQQPSFPVAPPAYVATPPNPYPEKVPIV